MIRRWQTRWLVMISALAIAGLFVFDLKNRRDREIDLVVKQYVSALKRSDTRLIETLVTSDLLHKMGGADLNVGTHYNRAQVAQIWYEPLKNQSWKVHFEIRRGKKVLEATQEHWDSRGLTLAKADGQWKIVALD